MTDKNWRPTKGDTIYRVEVINGLPALVTYKVVGAGQWKARLERVPLSAHGMREDYDMSTLWVRLFRPTQAEAIRAAAEDFDQRAEACRRGAFNAAAHAQATRELIFQGDETVQSAINVLRTQPLEAWLDARDSLDVLLSLDSLDKTRLLGLRELLVAAMHECFPEDAR